MGLTDNNPNTGWAGYYKDALLRAQQRVRALESQFALVAKTVEQAENERDQYKNERDRLKKCFSQIEILMAKYRIPEEE